jgi:large subunit ribosomal protein L22
VEKLVKSALANAQQKDAKVDVDSLVVSRATVDDAPPMKRIQHRSMGRVYRILKRACHVVIDLDLPGAAGASGRGARR